MKDLIAELEAATAPSRALDARIGYALDVKFDNMPQTWREYVDTVGWDKAIDGAGSYNNVWERMLPRFSASVDAMLERIPEGWLVHKMRQVVHAPGWENERWAWRVQFFKPTTRLTGEVNCFHSGEAFNPALAFGAAILRIAAESGQSRAA